MRRGALGAGKLLALVMVVFNLGCGGGGGNSTSTTGGQVVHGTLTNGVISVPVSINTSAALPFVVDTGAPLTLVDPTRFPMSGLGQGAGQASTMDVGGLRINDVEVIGASPCGVMVCSDGSPAGLLGGDVLINYVLTIDYHPASVTFDGAVPAPTVAMSAQTAFALQGGGNVSVPGMATAVTVPATRIALDVTIEGTTHPFVLDTGSSQMVLRTTLYDSLVADGRAQGSTNVSTVTGTTTQPTTQLKSVSVAGATQTSVAAVRSPLDLDALSTEVGHTVDGLLGGSYLSHYETTIDYPNRQLVLIPSQ